MRNCRPERREVPSGLALPSRGGLVQTPPRSTSGTRQTRLGTNMHAGSWVPFPPREIGRILAHERAEVQFRCLGDCLGERAGESRALNVQDQFRGICGAPLVWSGTFGWPIFSLAPTANSL